MPQPIDGQSEMARLTLVQRAQELAARAATLQAQRDLAEAERHRAEAERSVEETPESQSEHVDEDGRRKNPFVQRRKKKNPEDAPTEQARVFYDGKVNKRLAGDDGSNLDVTV